MPSTAKILAFAGSNRTESFNKKLIRVGVNAAKAAGAEVTLIDLRDYPLPLFDADLEAKEGLPANAVKLRQIFSANQGLFLSCPEYNSSMTGLFKNTIDWVSRPTATEPDLAHISGKVAALMSASPGGLGGLRGLIPVRLMLGNIGVFVLPNQLAVSKAHEAFNSDGSLKDAKQQKAVEKLAADLVKTITKLSA